MSHSCDPHAPKYAHCPAVRQPFWVGLRQQLHGNGAPVHLTEAETKPLQIQNATRGSISSHVQQVPTFMHQTCPHLLRGTIPLSVLAAPQLQHLDLSSNNLTGTLPSWTAPLVHLNVSHNRLHGPIAPFSAASQVAPIQVVAMASNLFTGPVPAGWISAMPNLRVLDLSANHFNGSLPALVWLIVGCAGCGSLCASGPLLCNRPSNSTLSLSQWWLWLGRGHAGAAQGQPHLQEICRFRANSESCARREKLDGEESWSDNCTQ